MRLFCENCGELFTEDEAITYDWTDEHGKAWTDIECPKCHSGIISQANECELCGEYVVVSTYDDYYPTGNFRTGDICSSCANEIDDMLITSLKDIKKRYPDVSGEDISRIVFNRAECKNWYEEEMRCDRDAARISNV